MNQDHRTTELLRLAASEREALHQVVIRQLPYVRRMVSLMLGRRLQNLYDVDDVLQDTMLQALHSLGYAKIHRGAQLRAWLAKVAENKLRDHWRRGGRQVDLGSYGSASATSAPLLSDIFSASESASPTRQARIRELEERLEGRILALPEHSRRVVVLFHLAGLNYEEIAEELGYKSAAGVRKAMARAMFEITEELRA